MTDPLKYTAQPVAHGWGVFEPVTGARIALYWDGVDGDTCELSARAHAEEETKKLALVADKLGVTPEAYVQALEHARHTIDMWVTGGTL